MWNLLQKPLYNILPCSLFLYNFCTTLDFALLAVSLNNPVKNKKSDFINLRENICGQKKKTPLNNGLYFFGKNSQIKFLIKVLLMFGWELKHTTKIKVSNEHIFDSYCSNLHSENNVYGIINATH